MKAIIRSFLLAAMLAGVAGSQAQVVFTIDGTEHGNPTFNKTVSGITLSAHDPNADDSKFAAFSTGLIISGDTSFGFNSFKFSFDYPVQITGYEIAFVQDASGTFNLTGDQSASSTGNDLSAAGSFSIAGTCVVAAGETITFTSNVSGGSPGWAELQSLTVTAVPEPAATMAVAAAVCGLAAFAARRRLVRTTGA